MSPEMAFCRSYSVTPILIFIPIFERKRHFVYNGDHKWEVSAVVLSLSF